jgi:hypothetical protein
MLHSQTGSIALLEDYDQARVIDLAVSRYATVTILLGHWVSVELTEAISTSHICCYCRLVVLPTCMDYQQACRTDLAVSSHVAIAVVHDDCGLRWLISLTVFDCIIAHPVVLKNCRVSIRRAAPTLQPQATILLQIRSIFQGLLQHRSRRLKPCCSCRLQDSPRTR